MRLVLKRNLSYYFLLLTFKKSVIVHITGGDAKRRFPYLLPSIENTTIQKD